MSSSNNYTITEKKIGRGNFGTVYIAKDTNGKEYAAKILNPSSEDDLGDQNELLEKIEILKRLNHPAIVHYYDICYIKLDNLKIIQKAIITEYIPNETLKVNLDNEAHALADINFDDTSKYIILLGIAAAMKYLHDNGIIHRDLKLENILLDENFYPKICDFGLSKFLPHAITGSMKLQMSGQIGTPKYMAPELLQSSNPEYTVKSDVYSFAIVAYEIVSNQDPYKGMRCNDILNNVVYNRRPKFPEFVPKKIQDLISECWSHNPEERPSFDEIFAMLISDKSYLGENVNEDKIQDYFDQLVDANVLDYSIIEHPKILKAILFHAINLENVELVASIISNENLNINEKYVDI